VGGKPIEHSVYAEFMKVSSVWIYDDGRVVAFENVEHTVDWVRGA